MQHSNRMSDLRRPKTSDPGDFWFISQAQWDSYMRDLEDGGAKKVNALNQLRKFDNAGRIMETDEGMIKFKPKLMGVAVPLHAKTPPRYAPGVVDQANELRAVYRARNDAACAYCKRMSRPGCTSATGGDDGRNTETVDDLRNQLEELREQFLAVRSENEGMRIRRRMLGISFWEGRRVGGLFLCLMAVG